MSNVTGKNIKKIDGGYIILSRKLIESSIWDKPPLYIKVWIYLLARAQHNDFRQLKRGELWVSIAEIQEACSWYVGYRKETPSRKQIFSILDWLRYPDEGNNEGNAKGTTNLSMIETTKATRGMLVNIVNYNIYQDPKNYEGNNEGNNEGNDEKTTKEQRMESQGNRINKNDKEIKKERSKDIYADFVDGFHELCPSLGKVLKITDTRKRAIKARMEENDLETIKTVLLKAEASDFLTGRSSDFKASFDWILKPANFIKILEGNYDNRGKPKSPPDKLAKTFSAIDEYERMKNGL